MRPTRPQSLSRLVAVCLSAFATACGTSNPAAPHPGGIAVVVQQHGNGADSAGYSVSASGQSVTVTPGAPDTIRGLSPGSYVVRLGAPPPQCAVLVTDSAMVTVAAGQTASVTFAVSCVGALAYNVWFGPENTQIAYLDEQGRTRTLTDSASRHDLEDWSPDGKRVVLTSDATGVTHIYTVAIDGTDLQQLTTGADQDYTPRYSPDGTKIIFYRLQNVSVPNAGLALYLMNADGSGMHAILDTLATDFDGTWANGGSEIVFSCNRFGHYWDVCAMAPDGSGLHSLASAEGAQHNAAAPDGVHIGFMELSTIQTILVTDVNGAAPINLTPGVTSFDFRWAPDSRRLVVATADANGFEEQLVNRDASGLALLTSGSDTAGDAIWSPDGAELALYSFRSGPQELWVMNPDGSGAHPITAGGIPKLHPLWKPNAAPGASPTTIAARHAVTQLLGPFPHAPPHATAVCVRRGAGRPVLGSCN